MSLGQEAVQSIGSAFKILRYAPDAYKGFNLTLDGFWRSFAAVFAILPMSWIMSKAGQLAALEASGVGGTVDPPLDFAHSTLAVLLFFGVWPVVAAGLCRLFGLGGNYVRYLIAYNWLSVPLTFLVLVPDALYLTGVVSLAVSRPAGIGAMGAGLYYSWYLARSALETSGPIALAFVLADVATSAMLIYLLSP